MDDVDRLTRLFEMQGTLQNEFGHDFNTMGDEALTDYISMNVLALTDELHEALANLRWKPWAKGGPGFRDRDKYAGEIADAMHFLLNLCLAARMTPDELMDRYVGKNKVNHQRISRGYDGTDKCDACGGALDEPGIVRIIPGAAGERYCSEMCASEAP